MNEEDQVLAWTIDSSKGNVLLFCPSHDFLNTYLSFHRLVSVQQVGYDRFEVYTCRLGPPLSR